MGGTATSGWGQIADANTDGELFAEKEAPTAVFPHLWSKDEARSNAKIAQLDGCDDSDKTQYTPTDIAKTFKPFGFHRQRQGELSAEKEAPVLKETSVADEKVGEPAKALEITGIMVSLDSVYLHLRDILLEDLQAH